MRGVTRQLTPSQRLELSLYADDEPSARVPSTNLVRRDLVRAIGHGAGYRITPFGLDVLNDHVGEDTLAVTGPCDHPDFAAHVSVDRIVPELPKHEEGRASRPGDEVIAFRCTVRVNCAVCGVAFGFRVPDVGDRPDRPTVNPTALELRVPLISPAELDLLGPLAAMSRGDGLPGFSVRLRDV